MNAVVYVSDQHGRETPHLELSAEELVFPIAPDPASDVQVQFYMKPGLPHELKAFFDDLFPRRRELAASGQQEIEAGDTAGCHAFIDKNFIRLGNVQNEDGSEPSLQQQIAFLNSNPDLKTRIYGEGYVAIKSDVDGDVPVSKKLTIGIATEATITTGIRLYDPERGKEQAIRIGHQFRSITEEDRIKYRRVIKVVEHRNRQIVKVNCDEIESLYGKTVQRLTGALVGGVPCTESNKAEWLPRVLFTHKAMATNLLFGQVQAKNV